MTQEMTEKKRNKQLAWWLAAMAVGLTLGVSGGMEPSLATLLTWVVAAVGNAGVPMGRYFLTLSLMAGQSAPVGIMGGESSCQPTR